MFKKIGRSLALQFTGFVFLLFLVNGAIFLTADVSNAQRQTGFRLLREVQAVLEHLPPTAADMEQSVPPPMRGRIRILNLAGGIDYDGAVFADAPLPTKQGLTSLTYQSQQYDVMTTAVVAGGQPRGYIQVAEPKRELPEELRQRILLYVLVSILISGLTYVVGLLFAKRSLRPAEETMQRLEQFTQDASHELRTPLAVLGSSLDVALKTQKYREGILSAKDDLRQIAGLVERLLELARLDKMGLDVRQIDLSSLVSDTADKFRHLSQEKSITLQADVAAGVTTEGDEALLRQVLGNLLTNALKFTPAGGVVGITLKKNALIVTDTGKGIMASDLPRIFDRFFQSDASRSQGGFGLGLALVRRIVEMHGWTIGVASEEGKGATFTVTFREQKKSAVQPKTPS